MKRDMDLIREALLAIEHQGHDPSSWIEDFQLPGYDQSAVAYHVWLLAQGGFIEASDGVDPEAFSMEPRCLTWSGAEFLDTIRDDAVWRRTKEGAAKAGGAGVELLWELAKAYGKLQLKERIGIDLTG